MPPLSISGILISGLGASTMDSFVAGTSSSVPFGSGVGSCSAATSMASSAA